MNWTTAKLASESIALLVVAGCAGYIAYLAAGAANDMHNTQVAAQTSVASVTATMEYINRPCASLDAKGHLLKDGTLCQLNNAIHDVRKIATQSGKQVEQTSQVIDAMSANLNAAGASVTQVATALTGTAHSASGMLDEAKVTIHDVQPVLASLKADGDAAKVAFDNLNALLTSKDALDTLHHINGTAENVEGITGSLDKMGAHLEKKVDAPPTWKSRVQEWLVPSAKIGIWYVTK